MIGKKVLEDAVGAIDPATAVLFLGSGFSLGATGVGGKSPPNGAGLRTHFIDVLGLPESTRYDLQILSDEFASDDEAKLYRELTRIFRVSSISEAQSRVLSENWRRIYTTNYDDVVEFHRLKSKAEPRSFDFSEPVPNKFADGAVVHLHGSIRLVTEDNVKSSLVLGEGSYVTQYIVRSPWYTQFERDIAFASAVFIVGYSLADYHIAALLMKNPETASRTFFIHGPDYDAILERRVSEYGSSFFVGTEGFVSMLESAPRASPSRDLLRLKSFKSLSPIRDSKSVSRPTVSEVYDLLVYGNFDEATFARSLPEDSYAFKRADLVRDSINFLADSRSLVIDGRIGNGKTVFQHLIVSELSQHGWSCFAFRSGRPDLLAEIAALRGTSNVLVFFDKYSLAQEAIEGLAAALPNAKFVVEVPTGTLEVRYHELVSIVPRPFERVSLGRLRGDEVRSFGRLCEAAGLEGPKGRVRELREYLIEQFENKSIRERVARALDPILRSHDARRVTVSAMIISSHQGAAPAGFLRSVLGVDPFNELKPFEDVASEIFEMSSDGFRVRSSIFSNFVMREFFAESDVSSAVAELIRAAAQRKTQRQYRILLSKLMSYGSLRRLFGERSEVNTYVLRLYEQLRHDVNVSAEPLFWLQFAIALSDVPRLDAAYDYIQNAYRRADALPGFETYQIDTQAFRISLLCAVAESAGGEVKLIEDIVKGMERVDKMLSDLSHRAYAVKVLENVLPFVKARASDLSKGERVAVGFWLRKIEQSLDRLPGEFKMTTASDDIKRSIVRAAEVVASSGDA